MLVIGLVREFMTWAGLSFSVKVFDPEVAMPEQLERATLKDRLVRYGSFFALVLVWTTCCSTTVCVHPIWPTPLTLCTACGHQTGPLWGGRFAGNRCPDGELSWTGWAR